MITALTLRRAEQEAARAATGEAWRRFYDEDGQEIALVFTERYGTPIDPDAQARLAPGATRQESDA